VGEATLLDFTHLRTHVAVLVDPSPVPEVRQLCTLFAMVRAGVGVSIVPEYAAGMVGPDVVLVPLRQRTHRSLVLTGPLRRPWHPAVTALVRTAGRPAAPGRPGPVAVPAQRRG